MAENDSALDCFSDTWCNLSWTSWISFATAGRRMDVIPDETGLYRIRSVGGNGLMCIGETAQSLRRTLAEVLQNTLKTQMPWNDPQPVATALWAWKDAKGYAFEFSASPAKDRAEREAVKSYLLYHYRQKNRESPSCNFGRFHRKYLRSSDEKQGIRGGKLSPNDPPNAAGGPSASPLVPTGAPGDASWMGLAWSPKRELKTHTTAVVPAAPGFYLLCDMGPDGNILAIGHAVNCSKALFDISKNPRDGKDLAYSFYCDKRILSDHNLREIENDLIGNYIETYQRAPEYQFRDTG